MKSVERILKLARALGHLNLEIHITEDQTEMDSMRWGVTLVSRPNQVVTSTSRTNIESALAHIDSELTKMVEQRLREEKARAAKFEEALSNSVASEEK